MHPSGMFPFHPPSLPLRAAAQRGLLAGLGSIKNIHSHASPTVSYSGTIIPLLSSHSPTCVMEIKGMERFGRKRANINSAREAKGERGRDYRNF